MFQAGTPLLKPMFLTYGGIFDAYTHFKSGYMLEDPQVGIWRGFLAHYGV
jgi:hypothetical protein